MNYTVVDDAEYGMYPDTDETFNLNFIVDSIYDARLLAHLVTIKYNKSNIYDEFNFRNEITIATHNFFNATGRLHAGERIVMSFDYSPEFYIPSNGIYFAHWDGGWEISSSLYMSFRN